MQTNKISKNTLIAAVLLLTLAACQSGSSGQPVVSPGNDTASQASGSCSAESQAKLIKAMDILFARGFDPAITESFLYSSSEYLGCSTSSGEWRDRFQQRQPAGYQLGGRRFTGDVSHDIRTGKAYDPNDPAATAASFPACYSQDDPFTRCRPIYHPLMGCKLDTQWKNFCTKKESMDGCWAGAKADVISAPPSRSAQMSRIQLASAVRLGGSETATSPKPRKTKAAPATPRVETCQPLGKRLVEILGL